MAINICEACGHHANQHRLDIHDGLGEPCRSDECGCRLFVGEYQRMFIVEMRQNGKLLENTPDPRSVPL